MVRQRQNMKKKYTYYAINDKSKEPYNMVYKEDLNEAIKYFSEGKQMSVIEFLKIYNVRYVKD